MGGDQPGRGNFGATDFPGTGRSGPSGRVPPDALNWFEQSQAVYGGGGGRIPMSAVPRAWAGDPRYSGFLSWLRNEGVIETPPGEGPPPPGEGPPPPPPPIPPEERLPEGPREPEGPDYFAPPSGEPSGRYEGDVPWGEPSGDPQGWVQPVPWVTPEDEDEDEE